MANRNDRSEQILRTAMHLFHERGFDGVGVDLIGETAGVSGPAIYRYFSGKDEILMTLLDEAIDRVLMSTGGQFDDPREELEHLVRGHVQRALEERELMSVWTRERNSIPKAYRSRLSARIKRYIDRWVDWLHACYPDQSRDSRTDRLHLDVAGKVAADRRTRRHPDRDGPAGFGLVGQRRVAHHVET